MSEKAPTRQTARVLTFIADACRERPATPLRDPPGHDYRIRDNVQAFAFLCKAHDCERCIIQERAGLRSVCTLRT